jgi:cytochrome c oxidase assembly factor 3, fungi type
MSQGLIRAREPYRVKNMITGLAISSFAVGVWLYSIRAVRQDNFDDVDEEARAMARAGMKIVDDGGSTAKDEIITTTVSGTGKEETKVRGLLVPFFNPRQKTIVWGAPPVDSIGRLGERGRSEGR